MNLESVSFLCSPKHSFKHLHINFFSVSPWLLGEKKDLFFYFNWKWEARTSFRAGSKSGRNVLTSCSSSATSCSKSTGIAPLSEVTFFTNRASWTVASCFHHAILTRTPLGCFLWTVYILTEIRISRKRKATLTLEFQPFWMDEVWQVKAPAGWCSIKLSPLGTWGTS